MSDFEWRLEEDISSTTKPGAPHRRRRMHPLMRGLLGLIVLAAIFALIIIARVDNTSSTIKQDVLATHRLIENALRNSDLDLFDTFIAHDPHGWVNAQHAAIEQDTYIDRAALGFALQSSTPTNVDVTLTADLQQAEVRSSFVYASTPSHTVSLQQTALYQLIDNRWTMVAPETSFWGNKRVTTASHMRLTYPARDTAIIQRLAQDLQHIIDDICADATCDQTIRIEFAPEAQSLIDLVNAELEERFILTFGLPTQPSAADTPIVLPTPTLLGLPVDEAGQQALRRFYVTHVIKTLLKTNFPTYPNNIREAALRRLLAEVDLLDWSAAAAPPPITLAQDIALLCMDDTRLESSLVKFDTASATWSTLLAAREFTSLTALPSGNGMILQGQHRADDGTHINITLWNNGAESIIFDQAFDARFPTPIVQQISPSEQFLTMAFSDQNGQPSGIILFDLSDCSPNGCTPTAPPTMPNNMVWSPDGQHTLTTEFGQVVLLPGDGQVQSPIRRESGLLPFWIDNDRYGYLRFITQPGAFQAEVIVTSISGNQIDARFPNDAWRAMLPQLQDDNFFVPIYLMADPLNSNLLWFQLSVNRSSDSPMLDPIGGWLFIADMQSGEIHTQLRFDRSTINALPSPDRARMAIYNHSKQAAQDSVIVYDVEHRRIEHSFAPGSGISLDAMQWSSDGRWLLVLDSGQLTLIEPASGYQYTARPAAPACASAVWVNRDS